MPIQFRNKVFLLCLFYLYIELSFVSTVFFLGRWNFHIILHGVRSIELRRGFWGGDSVHWDTWNWVKPKPISAFDIILLIFFCFRFIFQLQNWHFYRQQSGWWQILYYQFNSDAWLFGKLNAENVGPKTSEFSLFPEIHIELIVIG